MNEIQLSNNLTTIETEIKSYQNLAGQSIFEIGRRLKHVKENDLVHGEFRKWHEDLGINKDFASQSIKVSEELSTNVETFRHLGTTALKIITQLPEPERTKEHITSKGETKTPDEMTVRELRELKKKLKEERELNDSLAKQNEIANRKIEDLENVEPEVIEKYYEPDDYQSIKNMKQHLEDEREYYKNIADDFRKELKELTESKVVSSTDLDYTQVISQTIYTVEELLKEFNGQYQVEVLKNKIERLISLMEE